MSSIPKIPDSPTTRHARPGPEPDRRTYGTPIPVEHPAPWWYRFLSRVWPSRCREIPEPTDPDRVLLRQFAIVKHHAYLQQFASGENPRFMHSHPYARMLAIGLFGSYLETRIAGRPKRRRAPYLFAMDGGHVHHVTEPSPGHTSIFIGWGRVPDGDVGDKHYYGVPVYRSTSQMFGPEPITRRRLWSDHIERFVKRI